MALIHTPAGETVLDMGQNMTGWVRFRTDAPAGTRLHLQFGKVLLDGNFFWDNLRSAKVEYTHITDGRGAGVQPIFTFLGFRYVRISGWIGDLNQMILWAAWSIRRWTSSMPSRLRTPRSTCCSAEQSHSQRPGADGGQAGWRACGAHSGCRAVYLRVPDAGNTSSGITLCFLLASTGCNTSRIRDFLDNAINLSL